MLSGRSILLMCDLWTGSHRVSALKQWSDVCVVVTVPWVEKRAWTVVAVFEGFHSCIARPASQRRRFRIRYPLGVSVGIHLLQHLHIVAMSSKIRH